MWGHGEKTVVCNPRREAAGGISPADALISVTRDFCVLWDCARYISAV